MTFNKKVDKKPYQPKPLENESDVRNALLNLLSRRDYSVKELTEKLSPRCDEALLYKVLDAFIEAGYQSDERFAGALVRNRASQSYGKMRVLQDARRKGISDILIQAAIQEEAIDWFELAVTAYQKKFKEPLDRQDRKSADKRMRFLVQRGFSFDEAKYAIYEANENNSAL